MPRLATIINNNVDVEPNEKTQIEKTAWTKQNAKSKPTTNIWTLKIKIPNRFEDNVTEIGANYQLYQEQRCREDPSREGREDKAERQVQACHQHLGPHSHDLQTGSHGISNRAQDIAVE